MERLQAALATAREARSNTPPNKTVQPRVRTDRSRKSAGDELWESLEEITPKDVDLVDNRIVSSKASKDATPFDILRTKILLQMRQNNWKRLAITSPMPQSGKTTTACNLALGLGRQSELKSILFDFDLRDPSINSVMGHTPEDSVASVLQGHLEFGEQAVRIGKNLAVAMASVPEPDPARILLSEMTEVVLDEIQARYEPDIMIFDLPSVLVNDDTRAVLNSVDCALIISRANSTGYRQFDVCEREIAEHTNVLGVVLNACRYGSSATDFT